MESTQANRGVFSLAAAALASTGLTVLGLNWSGSAANIAGTVSPATLLALLKLASAGAVGFLLTSMQRQTAAGRTLSRAMEQAQILLCIAGALVVILIGDSMARAIGILGGAAIVRFRTPVDDPRDATLLFLLLGLGMATGLGYFGVAGLGAFFLCAVLMAMSGAKDQKFRSLSLQVVCSGPELPTGLVESILDRHAASYEPREFSRGERPVIRYQVSVAQSVKLAALSQELFESSQTAIQSVAWDSSKKERYLA